VALFVPKMGRGKNSRGGGGGGGCGEEASNSTEKQGKIVCDKCGERA